MEITGSPSKLRGQIPCGATASQDIGSTTGPSTKPLGSVFESLMAAATRSGSNITSFRRFDPKLCTGGTLIRSGGWWLCAFWNHPEVPGVWAVGPRLDLTEPPYNGYCYTQKQFPIDGEQIVLTHQFDPMMKLISSR